MTIKKSDLIFKEIINDIKNNKYKAGDKLPSEDLFCKTAKLGFKRNLKVDEIISQVLFFSRYRIASIKI